MPYDVAERDFSSHLIHRTEMTTQLNEKYEEETSKSGELGNEISLDFINVPFSMSVCVECVVFISFCCLPHMF